MNKWILALATFVMILGTIGLAFAQVINLESSDETISIGVINTTFADFWDLLDVPTDIPNSEFWYNQTSTGFVPFTGATANVNLGLFNMTARNAFFQILNVSTVDIFHVATENEEHALEIEVNTGIFGDIKGILIEYITGAITTGENEEAILINIDQFNALGGHIVGLEVIATEGAANVTALEAGAGVHVIDQLSGTFGDMESASVNGVNRLSEFVSTGSDIVIFVADNDFVDIGSLSKFEEIEFILATIASNPGIKPIFSYSTGATSFKDFNPTDGTNGLRDNGVIVWEDSDIADWATNGTQFLIRINRTQNSLNTNPIEDLVQIATTTEFSWDRDGDLFVNTVNATLYHGNGSLLTGISGGGGGVGGSNTEVQFNDGGSIAGDADFAWNKTNKQVLLPDGTKTLPSLAAKNDSDTGIYFGAALPSKSIKFTIGNTDVASLSTAALNLVSSLKLRITTKGTLSAPAISVGGDINSGIFNIESDELSLGAGGVEFIRLKETTQDELVFNEAQVDINFRVESDTLTHALFMDAATGFWGINEATPSFPLTVVGNVSTISIWADGNISAAGYITRTSVYDDRRGPVWDWIKDASYYKTDENIVHDRFYGAVTYEKIDTSRPVNVSVTEEECELDENNIDICQNVTGIKIEYPFKIEESGVVLDKEIDVLRQAVFELKQDNILMKEQLCLWNPNYTFC